MVVQHHGGLPAVLVRLRLQVLLLDALEGLEHVGLDEPAAALVRLRALAFAIGRSATDVAPRHPGSPTTPEGRLMRAHLMLDSGSVAYGTVTGAEWSRS